jgi:hypothetical protein
MHRARPACLSAWRWLIACLCLAAAAVHAQVPQTMAYQGFLTTSAGQPVSASLSMTFSLYDQVSAGTALWTETRTVQVSNGAYTVLLGEVTPLVLAFDKPYWLGVAVGPDPEMTPRQALASAPYAFKAGCNPGDRITCYTGAGDPGPGCATGVRICNAQGTGFGPCTGELVPNCNGACLNFQADVANCGSCGNACPTGANASASCTSGACGFACNAGFGNCDNNAGNGCEVNTSTNVSHCGACNNACPSPANAIAGCTAGTCGIAACNGGFANCNNNPADGCEVNTSTSVNHCGACGNTCFTVNGTPACSNGQCFVAACNAGFANCNGNAADGCETNTNSDVNHCGACNNACGVGKACVNSTCVTL